MPGVCLCHKEIDRFPSSSTAPKSEILGFKWNYLRLPQAEAHRFFEAWLKRWQKHAGYGRPFDVSHLNRFFHYLAVTRFPNQFEQYLLKKSQS